jgi:hypothetical protein
MVVVDSPHPLFSKGRVNGKRFDGIIRLFNSVSE